MPGTDIILAGSGTAAEAVVLVLLLWRRVFKTLPVFCLYMAWEVVSDLGQAALSKKFPDDKHLGLLIFVIGLAVDSLFQFGVLTELSTSVLRPLKNLLPRWTLLAVGVLIALICLAIWPFANVPGSKDFPLEGRLLIHLQQTFSILRILFFLVLAGCSQLLSIGWRDRALQIATGLGFYSMVSVAVSISHTSQIPGSPQYHLLDQLVSASYTCSLLYWVYSFAQQEAERREFTPQMQSFLLAMAGSARATKVALKDLELNKERDHRN